ncbi:hypothetical protein [Paracoccus fontiphilus]|uniref:Uncharacterized protein n=1 Tax=Paracoccus fontiphilus TaxID=1815556 RepID=A0ABV7IGE0_9RHOB
MSGYLSVREPSSPIGFTFDECTTARFPKRNKMLPENSTDKRRAEERLLANIVLIDPLQACALLRIETDDRGRTMQVKSSPCYKVARQCCHCSSSMQETAVFLILFSTFCASGQLPVNGGAKSGHAAG